MTERWPSDPDWDWHEDEEDGPDEWDHSECHPDWCWEPVTTESDRP